MATRTAYALSILTDYTNAEEAIYAGVLLSESATAGYVIYNTDLGLTRIWNGSEFTNGPAVIAASLPLATTTTIGVIPALGSPFQTLRVAAGGTTMEWATASAAVAWGGITGTLSDQTDLNTVLGSKAPLVSPSFTTPSLGVATATSINGATITSGTLNGNVTGTNTGDNATNTQYSGLAASKQDTLVSATNIKTVNGSTILGSGNLVVSGSYHFVGTLASDQLTLASVVPVSLTGLVFNYEANSKYRIWFMGNVQPTAATTGCGFQFDLSSAVTSIGVQFYHQLANTGTTSGGHSIADDASVGVSSGMPGTSTYPVTGEGILITGANTGTAQLRFRAEVAAITTCKAGFTLVVEKIA